MDPGSPILPALCTVMLAVVSAIFGDRLAWITALPNASDVTGTDALVAPAVIVSVAGTVAMAVLLELRLRVRPPVGAGADRFNVRFCVMNPLIVMLDGVKLAVAFTWTEPLAGVYSSPDALMVAEPRFTPVTCGWGAGAVCPAAIVTVLGAIVDRKSTRLNSSH